MKPIRQEKEGKQNSSGATLVEMLIAITINAFLITSIFSTWNTINIHIIKTRRNNSFKAEAYRISSMVATQLRRSPRVLQWHRNGISFISPYDDSKTISYNYFSKRLVRNEKDVPLISATAYVDNMSIEIEEQKNNMGLFNVTFTFKDSFENISEITMSIAQQRPLY